MRFALQQHPLPGLGAQSARPTPRGRLFAQDLEAPTTPESRPRHKAIPITDDLRSEFHFLRQDLAKVERAAASTFKVRSGVAPPEDVTDDDHSSMAGEKLGNDAGQSTNAMLEEAATLLGEADDLEAACDLLKKQRRELRDTLAAQQAEVTRLRQVRSCREDEKESQTAAREYALSEVRARCHRIQSDALDAGTRPAALLLWATMAEGVVKTAALQDALRCADWELQPGTDEIHAEGELEAIAAMRLTETANAMLR